jgi:hypothetical protein
MADDDWISVAEAARSVRIADACALINWAWKRNLNPLRGLPIGGGELVDIPSNEGGKIDCRKSRVVTGRLFTTYQHVITRRADLQRLAQVRAPPSEPPNAARAVAHDVAEVSTRDVNSVSEAPSKQVAQIASLVESLAPQATRKVKAVATVLRNEWPERRPYESVDGMLNLVRTKIRPVSKTTVERAIRWLRAQGWDQPRPD